MTSGPKQLAKCLAVLGTGSDVGKSVVAAALCRIFSDLGLQVAPFKAQNMSNNSFVTPLGGEMGRAQVVQAEAARARLHTDMNPILLKPCTDTGSQVVLHGKPLGNRQANEYFADTTFFFQEALSSLNRLRAEYELVVMEGAGSCAEVNLRGQDFVNFRMARAAAAPVVLVADIDRGGVFAQIVGTLEVIPPEDRDLVQGFIINKFRGDAKLFEDGVAYLEQRTGLPVLGLIPYFHHIEIDSEDGLPLDLRIDPPETPRPDKINVAVLRLPHISNFTDFAPLGREPSVRLHYLSRPRSLRGYQIVLLPGSKNVRGDLAWLRREDWHNRLRDYRDSGGRVGGLCGGYQILGRVIRDPFGVEGEAGETEGLGLLDVVTTLEREKILTRISGVWERSGEAVEGYEIHMGLTERLPGALPALRLTSCQDRAVDDLDGAVTPDGAVWGTYCHGLFDSPGFRKSFLESLAPGRRGGSGREEILSNDEFKDGQYDLLAEHFRAHLDLPGLGEIVGLEIRDRGPV